jgi:hypothetical protein
MWGCYTHSYIAFPLFTAPRGTVLTAPSPGEMTVKIRRTERSAGLRVPPQQAPAGWQHPQQAPPNRQAPNRLAPQNRQAPSRQRPQGPQDWQGSRGVQGGWGR